MEVLQSVFARMAGVSRSSINGKIQNKTLILNSAGKLDTDNPVNRAYLDEKQRRNRQTGFEPQKNAAPLANNQQREPVQNTTGLPAVMLEMTIRQLVTQYGNMENVERYVKTLRDLTAANEKDQRLQERRLQQIPKDFVISRMFSLLDQLMNLLLDLPDRITDQIIAAVLAEETAARPKIAHLLLDNITVAITDSKNQLVKQLETLKGKYDSPDTTGIQALTEQLDERLEAMQ